MQPSFHSARDPYSIFQKAELFEVPERVPFRLTQNVRDGMGVTKEEGVFRAVAEVTLRVLREHRAMLMSVLETLIYDPLVDWKKAADRTVSRSARKTRSKQNAPADAGANRDEAGKRRARVAAGERDLRTVELKLLGLPHPSKIGTKRSSKSSSTRGGDAPHKRAEHGLALSVEGHVSYLIKEATSLDNLSNMYSGWASWI